MTILDEYNKTRKIWNKKLICHAPFVNLNFEQNGNMTVCCYNRDHVLGTYPKNSIKDAWSGKKATELRKALSKNDFTKGCRYCLHQIKSKNFSSVYARNYDKYSPQKNEYPCNGV